MNKVMKILMLTLMLSFLMAVSVTAEETEEAAVETGNCEPGYEVSTHAAIVITLDEEYLVTVGQAMEVIDLEAFTLEGQAQIEALLTDEDGNLTITLESLESLIQTLQGEETELELMVSAEDEALLNDLAASLGETFGIEIETELEEPGCELEERPEFIVERFAMAEALGITPGRMHLIEKYIASLDLPEGETLSEEELMVLAQETSVKDLMKQTKANRKGQTVEEADEIVEVDSEEAEASVEPEKKGNKPEKEEKVDKPEKSEKSEKANKSDKSDKKDKSDKGSSSGKGNSGKGKK